MAPEQEQALAELRNAIDSRIRPLLGRLPEDQLASLIDRMARLQLNYRGGPKQRD